VVAAGVTLLLPVLAFTLPRVGEMVTVVAFSTVQLRVELPPGAMVAGDAEKFAMLTTPGELVDTVVVAEACRLSVFFTVRRKL
jgi:hypothetical protein